MNLRIEFKLRFGLRFDDSAGVHVGWCPALNVYSQGETKEQAKAAVEEASLLFIKHCFQRKILDDILRDNGFEAVDKVIDAHAVESVDVSQYPESYELDVPLHLFQAPSTGDGACLS